MLTRQAPHGDVSNIMLPVSNIANLEVITHWQQHGNPHGVTVIVASGTRSLADINPAT